MRRALTILLLCAFVLNAAVAGVTRSAVLCLGDQHAAETTTDQTDQTDHCDHDHSTNWPTPVPADDEPTDQPESPCGCIDVEFMTVELTPPAEPQAADPIDRSPIAIAMLTPARPALRQPPDIAGPPRTATGIASTRLIL